MTREEIITELNHRSTQKYLVYLALKKKSTQALQEIMLDYYEDVKMLKFFDLDLQIKHKNIINAFRYLEGYDNGEATIKQFHEFVTLFERLHTAIDEGGSIFHDCLNAVEEILDKHEKAQGN